jgi:hypothetical protein
MPIFFHDLMEHRLGVLYKTILCLMYQALAGKMFHSDLWVWTVLLLGWIIPKLPGEHFSQIPSSFDHCLVDETLKFSRSARFIPEHCRWNFENHCLDEPHFRSYGAHRFLQLPYRTPKVRGTAGLFRLNFKTRFSKSSGPASLLKQSWQICLTPFCPG